MEYPITRWLKLGEYPHITFEEFLALVNATKDPRKAVMMKVMWELGLRISEVLSLTKESIIEKPDGFLLKVETRKQKRPVVDILPISDELGIELVNYAKFFCKDQSRLFPFTRQGIHTFLKKLGKKVLNKHVHPHMFRHGRAYHLAKKGTHPYLVSKVLRHRDIRTTLSYFHPSEQDIRKVIEK
ncbi:MAG: site-specific integrase [Candidatus Aenigmatarchaeota archaeon]